MISAIYSICACALFDEKRAVNATGALKTRYLSDFNVYIWGPS
jgi:hypothetical protein